MPKPEILTSEAHEGPDGSIFLPRIKSVEHELNKRLSGLYLCRGPDSDLDPEEKVESAALLNSRKAQLAELALRAN